MPARTERLEARVATDERERICAAAELSRTSTSSFIVSAALEKADAVLVSHRRTVVPSDYFDRVLASLDDATAIPELKRVVESVHDRAEFRRR